MALASVAHRNGPNTVFFNVSRTRLSPFSLILDPVDFKGSGRKICGFNFCFKQLRSDEILDVIGLIVFHELSDSIKFLPESDMKTILFIHWRFIRAYLDDNEDKGASFKRFIEFPIPDSAPELYWYRIHAFFYIKFWEQRGFTNGEVRIFLEWIKKIPNTLKFKKIYHQQVAAQMLILMLQQFGTTEYLDISLFDHEVATLFNRLRLDLWHYLPHVRHSYIESKLVASDHSIYFNHVYSALLDKAPESIVSFPICVEIPSKDTLFGVSIKIDFSISQLDFLKFVSHLVMVQDPEIRYFNERYADPDVSEKAIAVNDLIRKRLVDAGFLNSEGMLIRKSVFYLDKDQKLLGVRPEFISTMVVSINRSLTTSEARKRLYAEVESWCVDTMLSFCRRILARRDRLDAFVAVNMLAMFYCLFVDYKVERESLLNCPDSAKFMIKESLELAYIVDQFMRASQSKTALVSSQEVFLGKIWELQNKIMINLLRKPHSFIIQTGTPKDGGALFSNHAFYVVFRHIPSDVSDHPGSIQIMIANGGNGLEFHNKDKAYRKSEFSDLRFGAYHPVALTTLDLGNDAHKKFLRHYLYRVLALPYMPAGELIPPGIRISHLKNIYLGAKDGEEFEFHGFNFYKTKLVKRLPSEDFQSYRAQLAGNCTAHNFFRGLSLSGIFTSPYESAKFEDICLNAAEHFISAIVSKGTAKKGAGAVTTPFHDMASAACSLFLKSVDLDY